MAGKNKREEVEWIMDIPSALRRINRELVILENQRGRVIFRKSHIAVNESMRKYHNIIAKLLETQSKDKIRKTMSNKRNEPSSE